MEDNPVLNFDSEIWEDVKGFEGKYQISTYGRVRALQDNHGSPCEKLRKARKRSDTCEYLYLQLWSKNVPLHRAVHRLVAEAFIPNPENKPMVNHMDGDKLNNNVCNLEWVTCTENHKHAFATALKMPSKAFLGKKWGGSSKYHNVTWDKSRNRWVATLKDAGKTLFQKRFANEIDAAQYVNEMLDMLGITNRPRNIIN